ncbi:hypothetical protein B0T17DRAFT_488588 [Bombardia bombarda]|uniref:Rhodopsin domain-containing protein n=1 Tax=Bombardia bombarda TaxID=252184 RepID=A0AA40C9M7_9PEZI|nr:hypothetical protein B0T17DRAFT_488588 [Bombardia bombarda]
MGCTTHAPGHASVHLGFQFCFTNAGAARINSATIMISGNLPGDNRAYQIQVPCVVLFVFTLFFLTVRLWARVKLGSWSGLGRDDWTILTSWIFASTVAALMLAACEYGFGQHIANLSRPNKLVTLKLYYVAQAFYKLTINLTKSSILLLYLRIFVQKWFRRACWALLAVVIVYMVATFGLSVWQCTPVPRAWDKSIPGTCINLTINWYANAGFSIATDILILGLPMYPIYASQLSKGQKIALMAVFALGLFTTITSIFRLQTLSFSSTSPDTTYDIASSIWTMIEINMAIICACLPVCRLPLAYVFPAHFSSNGSEKKSGESDDSSDPKPSPTYPYPNATTPPAPGFQWEHEENNGSRRHILSQTSSTIHQCSMSTSHADLESQPGEPKALGIHMVKHYSIKFDDGDAPARA